MFASVEDRLTLRSGATACDFTVQIVTKDGNEIEIAADDSDHALTICTHWMEVFKAERCEIFRILYDGSINPTIGPVTKEAWRSKIG